MDKYKKQDVYYDELSQTEKPVPFSMEYYNKPEEHKDLGNIPEKMTQAEYDKIADNLWKTVNELDSRTCGLYRSVYVSYAERVLAELKKRIVPEKRKWTEAEIEEARRYVADKMYGLTKDRKFICFYKDSTKPTESIAVLYKKTTPSWGMVQNNDFKIVATYVKKAISKCMPTDEQNADIGKMVAVKKMFNESLPLWLKGKEK